MFSPGLLKLNFSGDPNSCVSQPLITPCVIGYFGLQVLTPPLGVSGSRQQVERPSRTPVWSSSAGKALLCLCWICAATRGGIYRQKCALSWPFHHTQPWAGAGGQGSGNVSLTHSQIVDKMKVIQWHGSGKAKKMWEQKNPWCGRWK